MELFVDSVITPQQEKLIMNGLLDPLQDCIFCHMLLLVNETTPQNMALKEQANMMRIVIAFHSKFPNRMPQEY
jgi:hypothetical protein